LKEGFGDGAYLYVGALLGNLEEGCFTGDPEGYVEEGSGDKYLSQ